MSPKMNALKKDVFYQMLDMAGRVFIVVRFSENVLIGARGFTEEEKKNGIILVFNKNMNFSWDDAGITSNLVFGTSAQKCFIPLEDIAAIYSPELNSQFVTSFEVSVETPQEKERSATGVELKDKTGSNVVKVDFRRKRAPRRTTSAPPNESG